MATVTDLRRKEGDGGEAHRFNYRGMYRYLITMPVPEGKTPFTERDAVLQTLSALREAASNHQFDVYAYCLLPDRLLLLIRGRSEEADMKAFSARFRASSNDLLQPHLQHPLWKAKYIERVLRKQEESKQVALEMFQLPVKAGLAPSPLQYPYLGSFITSVEKIFPSRPAAPAGRGGRGGKPWQKRPGQGSPRPPRRPRSQA